MCFVALRIQYQTGCLVPYSGIVYVMSREVSCYEARLFICDILYLLIYWDIHRAQCRMKFLRFVEISKHVKEDSSVLVPFFENLAVVRLISASAGAILQVGQRYIWEKGCPKLEGSCAFTLRV